MIKSAARLAARLLPQSVRARIAQYRFGYAGSGPGISLTRSETVGGDIEVALAAGPRFTLDAGLAPDFANHFTDPGDSRDEMAAFLAASLASAPDAVLIDVGSNKGLFSLVHLATGRSHRAILVEPSRPLCADAEALLRRNGVSDRADIVVAGASSTPGERRIVTDALGFARIVEDGDGEMIPFVPLDDLCADRGLAPAIVKIDVEGGEADVLRGAGRTLRAHRPLLFLELHFDLLEQIGEPVQDLLGRLSSRGYRFETAAGDPLPAWRLQRSLMAIQRIVARADPS